MPRRPACSAADLTRRCHRQEQQGILERDQIEECITSQFNPIRAGFHGHKDVWTRDVLNLGVRPDRLIEKVCVWHCCRVYLWVTCRPATYSRSTRLSPLEPSMPGR